ncbi:MAG TPA: TIR domain-containing protein, partial [Propionibacteriaceae bacterium]|nr:TIR domain-containing protein [Propionibacteriaceae bacterium]
MARAVQSDLDHDADVCVDRCVFGVGGTTLGSLVGQASEVDFAVMVVNSVDTANVRGQTRNIARDNVIFELGLFSGGIGRERTFMGLR